MSKLTSTIQAILLTFSLVFIIIFIYLFATNINLIVPIQKQGFPEKASTPSSEVHHQHHHEHDGPTAPTVPMAPGKTLTDSKESDRNSEKETNSVIVSTKLGQIRGFQQDVFGTNVSTFLGIPFASPPTGSLRFKRTTPLIIPWKGVLEANKFKPKCVQVELDHVSFTDLAPGMSEDCLYLNIWTPSNVKNGKSDLKPVMIWIYGGGFFMGTSNYDETDGRVLSAVGDVVVVTFEYRVGAFGFIDLGTETESGNQGLFDQLTVIKWVKENIESFGGNPNSITLFGESSGAISIGLHLMSPESSELVTRVILQSGSPMMTNAFFTRSEKSIPEFVKVIGCLDDSSDESSYNLKCLRKKSISEMLNVTKEMHNKYFFAFPPNVDEYFLNMVPTEVIKSEEKEEIFKNVQDILIGNNVKSFSYMLWLANRTSFGQDGVATEIESIDDVKAIMSKDIGHLLQMPSFQINFLTSKLFKNLTESDPSNKWLDKLIELLGDVSFVCPSKVLMDEMAALGKNVHSYYFTHQSGKSDRKWAPWFGTTLHDEIPLVFGHPLRFPLKYSGDDIEMSKRMMKTWAHFARTGQLLDQLDVKWPQYTENNRVFMELNARNATVGINLHGETCQTFKLGFDLLN